MLTTTLQLDYSAILAHTARPIHLALTFHAGGGQTRPMPVAFVAVIDRSGSMSGPPILAAKAAARLALRNLRPGDHFGVVVFDSTAEVVLPLMEARQAQAQAHVIDAIETCASTNLAAGWCLGRDQLLASPAGMPRRLLLLSDGLLNQGITEPVKVRQLAIMGLEMGQIRTSCLGFGDGYNEDLMEAMALGSGGLFHDANDPEKLPVVFGKELDGLQNVVVQNLRVTLRPSALQTPPSPIPGKIQFSISKTPPSPIPGKIQFPISNPSQPDPGQNPVSYQYPNRRRAKRSTPSLWRWFP